jgi:hypothetical protein
MLLYHIQLPRTQLITSFRGLIGPLDVLYLHASEGTSSTAIFRRFAKSLPHQQITRPTKTSPLFSANMARTRVSRAVNDHMIIREDDARAEQEDEDILMDESGDPLEESGCTRTDGSDAEEEIDEAVAEDIARLEESFRGINKRYRLINRIGEGELVHAAQRFRCMSNQLQARSQRCTRPRIFSMICTRMTGILKREKIQSGRLHRGEPPATIGERQDTSPSRKYTSQAALLES